MQEQSVAVELCESLANLEHFEIESLVLLQLLHVVHSDDGKHDLGEFHEAEVTVVLTNLEVHVLALDEVVVDLQCRVHVLVLLGVWVPLSSADFLHDQR